MPPKREKFYPNMELQKFKAAASLGVIIGIFGIIISSFPVINRMEHDLGLDWLFKLRGPHTPSEQVMVAALDRESSDALGYPNLPRKWSRHVHAKLVNTLTIEGARAIGFDLLFSEERPGNQDQRFAEALKTSNKTVLFKNLFTINHEHYRIERLEPPIPLLAEAALDTAPFALPKVPAKVSQAWLFKTGAGDTPTLPMVLLHVYMQPHLEVFSQLLAEGYAKLGIQPPYDIGHANIPQHPTEQASFLRKLFHDSPALGTTLKKLTLSRTDISDLARRDLQTWIYALNRGDSIILNLYGPARSIKTQALNHFLEPDLRPDVRDKVIFVGFSEILQPEQKDGFYTSYTGEDGIDISGVELMATTLSNLFNQEAIQPAPTAVRLGLIFSLGLAITAITFLLPGGINVLFAAAAAGGWLWFATHAFTMHQLWLPLPTILLFQILPGLVLALVWQYRNSKAKKEQLANHFEKFVDPDWVQHLDKTGDLQEGTVLPAACLFTDMESFTHMGEELSPCQLHERLNDYFAHLEKPVKKHGGKVTDMTGDSMLSLWVGEQTQDMLVQACSAALEIQALQNTLNIHTRIGLNLGEVYLGPVGVNSHMEYRAIGDTVNTTKRLESLNKELGTRILTTQQAANSQPKLITRRMGKFLLKGKSTPTEVFEICGYKGQLPTPDAELIKDFEDALALYEKGHQESAKAAFTQLVEQFDDPASQYYLHKLDGVKSGPP